MEKLSNVRRVDWVGFFFCGVRAAGRLLQWFAELGLEYAGEGPVLPLRAGRAVLWLVGSMALGGEACLRWGRAPPVHARGASLTTHPSSPRPPHALPAV